MNTDEPDRPYLKLITDSKKVHDSPLNLSPAKALYSFSRSKRFDDNAAKSLCQEAFYNVPAKRYQGHTGTGIGYASKYDFTKNAKDGPAPNAYLPKNLTVTEAVEKKHGYTFGVSREQYTHGGLAHHLKNAASAPGPADYLPLLPKSQIIATMKSRINYSVGKINGIGPGQYELPPAFQLNKQLFNSRHRNARSIRFPPIRPNHDKENAQRESDVGKTNLSCDTKFQINGKGSYFNSKYHNTLSPAFGKQTRPLVLKKSSLPGPGDYTSPSEFGVYVSSKAM